MMIINLKLSKLSFSLFSDSRGLFCYVKSIIISERIPSIVFARNFPVVRFLCWTVKRQARNSIQYFILRRVFLKDAPTSFSNLALVQIQIKKSRVNIIQVALSKMMENYRQFIFTRELWSRTISDHVHWKVCEVNNLALDRCA